MTERKIVQDAKKIEELMWQLEVNADQEEMDGLTRREIEEYPDAEILSEAQYVLSTYNEDGHNHGSAFLGTYVEMYKYAVAQSPSDERLAEELRGAIADQKRARADAGRLKRFLKAHKKTLK